VSAAASTYERLLAACRERGFVVTGDGIKARLWEIAENLHRSELTVLERSEHVAEWIKLTEQAAAEAAKDSEQDVRGSGKGISGQNVQKKRGRPEGGISAAARELNIQGKTEDAKRKNAERAVKVASLTDEAKEVAREVNLDDNRSALLEAAKAPKEKQAEVLREIAEKKKAKPEPSSVQWTAEDEATYGDLLDAWEKATPAARSQFIKECSRKVA
jgi:hypothetical protein